MMGGGGGVVQQSQSGYTSQHKCAASNQHFMPTKQRNIINDTE